MSKILICTRTPPGLAGGSGFHLRNMIEVLKEKGHIIVVRHENVGAYDEPIGDGRAWLINLNINWENVDVVIADYSWMCGFFDGSLPKRIKKICFVHDLRCRIIPCLQAIGYKDMQNWTEEKEAELLRKADVLMVLNKEDRAYCERMAPHAKIIRIGIALGPIPHDPAKEIPGRCIYVASASFENDYAINRFQKEVWPKVLKEIPHASLMIVRGYTDKLDDLYAEAQLAVVPHCMQGGMKIKTAEAFAHGLPVVGNVCAFDGFEGEMPFTDNSEVMADFVIKTIRNIIFCDWLKKESLDICKKYMTSKAAYGQLLDILV